MANPYKRLLNLLPQRPLQIGTVLAVEEAGVVLQLPGGAIVTVRGEASEGSAVFFRDGVIEGPAPTASIVDIEV